MPNESFGDAIKAHVGAPGGSNKPIVLMGHRDTVFPKGEAGRRPFRIDNGRAYGPGVCDMKAGLVMNAFVLAAYHKFGGAPAPLVGLITSDEEIGSPACRPIIEETARNARAVLNSEPGRPSGNVVTGRKGGVFMKMEVVGKAAHSGGNFEQGVSAIGELAHKIVALHAITDIPRGTTVNVGLISGGQSVNTVAPAAECQIDLRYITPPDRADAMRRIEEIVARATVPGTSATLAIKGEFKPLVQDEGAKALFDTYRAAMQDLGRPLDGEFTGGCADFGLHRERRLPDALRRRPRRRQGAFAGRIPRGRELRAPRPGDGADDRAARLTISSPVAQRRGRGAAKAVEGASLRTALGIAPSTMLRMVPLPRLTRVRKCHARRTARGRSSNSIGVAGASAPSISSRRSFVATPPRAEKPPSLPPAARTRWHGTTIGNGFCPSAWPTSRARPGSPSRAAISP